MVTTSGVPASGSSAGPVRLGIVAGAIRYAHNSAMALLAAKRWPG